MMETMNNIYMKSMERCFDYSVILSPEESEECNRKFRLHLIEVGQYVQTDMAKRSQEVLNVFHPTRDRMNNPLLSFLMGRESMKILSTSE